MRVVRIYAARTMMIVIEFREPPRTAESVRVRFIPTSCLSGV
jgi:hypothetical protein